ncbi:circumsporozoite protein-like [Homalodisca vitripennis]|uniref:circumsporozoite protein-like n=1 Tax=Homalodisca vitripennis TaxID=197043 RepID=UPI001EEA0CAF|nr:circumsporozoite protein-like [Homalodisca vitripennis]KAG8326407.1 hypothetical protein J6590_042222 [Homalodisca vitripennis]
MAYTHVILCAMVFFQGTWSLPATSVSTGSQLVDEFNKNLQTVMQNLQNGASKVSTPAIHFGFSTIPNLISNGVKTATDTVSKLTEAGRDAAGNVITGAGHVAGSAASMGSALAGGALQVAGSGLGAVTGGVDAAATAGLDFANKMADSAAQGIKTGGSIGNSALTAAGDGLAVASSGIGVVSNGIGGLINAMGGLMNDRIKATEQAIATMIQSGLDGLSKGALNLTSQGQVSFYNALKSFLQILVNMQTLFNNWVTSIAAASSTAASGTAASGTAASGTAASGTSGSASGGAKSS